MLERITKYVHARLTWEACFFGESVLTYLRYSFMAHPETLLPMPTIDDPLERFVSVVRFYLSGWHIKPPYVHVVPFVLAGLIPPCIAA